MSYKIKNWHQFQHFKDRKPPWIKLYRELLDDVHWHDLDPKAAKNLVMLWLLASEYDGELPDFRTLTFRLRVPENEAKSIVSKLSHWVIQTDDKVISGRYQDDTLEIETEIEKEKETESKREAKRGSRLPDDWFPSMEDHSFAERLGVVGEVETFRDYWHSQPSPKGVKLDWSATWRNWCRRASQNKPKSQYRETPMQTGLRIIEEMESAKHNTSNSSGNPALVGIQRQPSGSGDLHSPGSNQPRGLLAISPAGTVPSKDWFNLDE